MKKRVFKMSALSSLRAHMATIIFAILIVFMILHGLNETERSSRAEGLRILEESIRRATVTCYAIEGYYPANLTYIEENYGVFVDKSKYIVHYEIFASNILPEIVVIERK